MKDENGNNCCRVCLVELTEDNWNLGNELGSIKSPEKRSEKTNKRSNNIRYICNPCDREKSRLYRLKKKQQRLEHSPDGYGVVYALTHPSFKGWVKVGKTVNLKQRMGQYKSGTPFDDYSLEAWYSYKNCKRADGKIHMALAPFYKNREREWYRIDLAVVKEMMYNEWERELVEASKIKKMKGVA